MGYQVTGAEGFVTSWSGTFYTYLLSKMRAMNASVSAVGETVDVTSLGDFGKQVIPGLSSWTAQLEGYPLTNSGPELGNVGNVVFTNSTNIFIDSFSLNISADAYDITSLGASPTWRLFRPGPIRWSGTLNARIDNALNFPFPAIAGAAPISTTFTYGTLATAVGTINITNVSPAVRVGGLTLIPIAFEGTGPLALGGTNSIFQATTLNLGRGTASGSMAVDMPEWNSTGSSAKPLVINLARDGAGQVLTGADSFWTSIGIACGVGSATKVSIGVQGSSTLTCT